MPVPRAPVKIEVRKTRYGRIRPLHDQFLAGVDYQIVHATVLSRGLADPYVIRVDGRTVGYGAIWNSYYPGRAVEFYCTSGWDERSEELFRAFLLEAKVLSLEAQTNMPIMNSLLVAFGREAQVDKVLFDDGGPSSVANPGVEIREDGRSTAGSEWVLQAMGRTVARGGYMTHYNPPFADIYVEVEEHARRRGLGSYLVQELKRICYERGFKPVARCDPDNHPSRRTLKRAGLRECGRLLSSDVDHQKLIAR